MLQRALNHRIPCVLCRLVSPISDWKKLDMFLFARIVLDQYLSGNFVAAGIAARSKVSTLPGRLMDE